MRHGLLIGALTLVLACCTKPTQPDPVAPPPDAVTAAPDPIEGARTMTVRSLTLKGARDVDPSLVAALDAGLRSVLEGTRHYVLVDEGADLVLTPAIEVFNVREVGGGAKFTMRDLGLDPGPEYVEGEVVMQATLAMGGEEVVERAAGRIRGGDGTPGVSRVDRDRDGRLDLQITPEGAAALVRPVMLVLAGKLVARTHPVPGATVEPRSDETVEPRPDETVEPVPEN